jgi:FkbM family methyltransferase
MINTGLNLQKKLDGIEKLARGSILKRFLKNPFRYVFAIGYWRFIYPIKKIGKFRKAETFFGKEMQVVLPSATEIYLFGAKTHDSEIRLARFLMDQLMAGDTFFDVGAHFGYFTLLASQMVGEKGKVFSFEASHATFGVLQKNTASVKNIIIENKAAADVNKELIFHEYPVLLSEYNSLVAPAKNEFNVLKNNTPKEIKITGVKLGDYLSEKNTCPKIIKIDVEGAELQVLTGLADYLKNNSPILVMEYLMENNQNRVHEQAVAFLEEMGFEKYIIDENGKMVKCKNIKAAMADRKLDSDNIVFKR